MHIALLLCAAALVWAESGIADLARSGDRAAVLKLASEKADVNARASDGATALLWASFRGDLELVNKLLAAGADPNLRNDFGATPLSEAAAEGHTPIVEALLKAKADPNLRYADDQTVLMVVARSSNVAMAKALLDAGADVNAVEKQRGQTALMWAAAQTQGAMTKLLLARGADPNILTPIVDYTSVQLVSTEPRAGPRPYGGLSALFYATREGCLECTKALVEGGAKLDWADQEGVSALINAIWNQHYDTAKYLIEAGADVNKWDWWGRGPLWCAVDLNTIPHGGRADAPSLDETTSLEIIRLLLERGANPNLQLKLLPPYRSLGSDRGVDRLLSTGSSPLLRAAKAMDAAAIAVLLKFGADPNLPNNTGVTPTLTAAGLGSVDADTRGWYTVEGVQQQSIASLELLITAGGDIHRKGGPREQQAIHAAAFWGWNDVVEYLAKKGADLNAKDSGGMTPIDAAMGRAGGNSRGNARIDVHQETADFLVKLGAKAVAAAR